MTKEGHVKRAVEDLLKAERIRYWRMNAGNIYGSTNGRKWRIRGHGRGTPDFLAVPQVDMYTTLRDSVTGKLSVGYRVGNPILLWVEVKAPYKSPTPEQLQFADEARNNGEYWLCVDDVRQLSEWLKENRVR